MISIFTFPILWGQQVYKKNPKKCVIYTRNLNIYIQSIEKL